jgi:hypothetical protein
MFLLGQALVMVLLKPVLGVALANQALELVLVK